VTTSAAQFAKFLDRVRRACRSGTWSLGVNLSRAGAVAVESRDDEEIVLRVRAPGRLVAPTVVLYPGENEWECDCPSRVNPCEHVAAAAIALGQAEDGDSALPSAAQTWARVVYRFARAKGGLTLERVIARSDGTTQPLTTTLSALLNQPGAVQPEQCDLQADRLLERRSRGVLLPEKLDALVRVLVGARNVLLDGRPVALLEEEVLPRATVEDRGEDVVLTIARDPRVTEVLSAGLALCGDDTICRLGELTLSGAYLQHLPVVQVHAARQIGELTTRTLPELARRMGVEVRSRRLPPVVRGLRPRLVLDLQQVGASLSVLPTLVYGAPPCVRIDEGRMVYLKGPVPVRDEGAERGLIQRLRDELNLVPGRRATFDGADAPRFAAQLKRWRGDLTGQAAGLVGGGDVGLDPRLRVITGDGDPPVVRVELSFVTTGENAGRTVDAERVVRAWQEGLGLVPLDGGGWAALPQGWLDRHGDRLADLLAARAADGRVAAHALPVLGALCEALEQPQPPGLDRLAPLLAGFDRIPEAPLPADLTVPLRPYQRVGASWLAFLRSAGLGGLLADDMGLGKTVQALCAVRGRGPREVAPQTLVVCPTSVLPNWEAEVQRFRPELRVVVYHGPGRRLEEVAKADITLTSYALLRLDADALAARTWDMVILDEAQAIKNPDSQVARAAFALRAELRVALTGTPVENRLEELWSLMHFTNPGLLGGRRDFDERFSRPIAEGSAEVREGLRRRTRPFILRRLKSAVAPELPPRTEAVLSVALDERERAVYDAVQAAARTEVVALLEADGGGKGVMKALEALLRLRQAACHPALVPGQEAQSSSKVQRLVEALETAREDGHKALVFSQWTSLLDLIEPPLREAGIEFVRLDGSTRDRGEVVSRFQSEGGPPVMLVSLRAGGSGLNLTAADHVFLVDPWWNPAVEAQAADRAHRIGQERPVFIYRLVALGTVEERILKLQDQKRALFEAALGDGGAAAGLTRDDLLALLG
jgi:superfamily II DNA or RNA helicase